MSTRDLDVWRQHFRSIEQGILPLEVEAFWRGDAEPGPELSKQSGEQLLASQNATDTSVTMYPPWIDDGPEWAQVPRERFAPDFEEFLQEVLR